MAFTLLQTAKKFPRLPYEEIKTVILGTKYDLTLIFVGEKRAQQLNKDHRNASYVPNVLSFPLDDMHGEIYITPLVAAKECKKFNLTPNGYIGFLFIHGLLHLKGHDHSDMMDKAEERYMKRFNIR